MEYQMSKKRLIQRARELGLVFTAATPFGTLEKMVQTAGGKRPYKRRQPPNDEFTAYGFYRDGARCVENTFK
jgi:hypothetical protein